MKATTIIFLHPCRLQRLRDAFALNLEVLGPMRTAQLASALQIAYKPHNSPRTNYNYSMHALEHAAGIMGLAAISLIKEAWNEGSLSPDGPPPASVITHPSTNTPQ